MKYKEILTELSESLNFKISEKLNYEQLTLILSTEEDEILFTVTSDTLKDNPDYLYKEFLNIIVNNGLTRIVETSEITASFKS